MKYSIIIILALTFSCNKSETKVLSNSYSLDVINDSKKEILIVQQNKKDHSKKDIFLNEVSEQNRICSILPTYKKEYVTTYPEIENVYLEANNIQTEKKGFRIIIRNTDICPDIQYLDLSYKASWTIERFGIINTCEDNNAEKYICSENINKSIKNLFGENLEINTKKIKQLYFNGKSNCK